MTYTKIACDVEGDTAFIDPRNMVYAGSLRGQAQTASG